MKRVKLSEKGKRRLLKDKASFVARFTSKPGALAVRSAALVALNASKWCLRGEPWRVVVAFCKSLRICSQPTWVWSICLFQPTMLRSLARLLPSDPSCLAGTIGASSWLAHGLTSTALVLGSRGNLPVVPLLAALLQQPSLRVSSLLAFRGFGTGPPRSGFAMGEAPTGLEPRSPSEPIGPTKAVLYRGRGMRLFRLLVRMKIFQLSGVAALAIPITTFLSQGEISAIQAVIASSLLVGSAVASTTLWYYSRRYVGELSLLRDAAGCPAKVRFSVLDFWGNREDNDVQLPAIVPPLQGVVPQVRAAMLQEMLIPMDVEGDRQYFLSLRYGFIVDKQQLLDLLEGRLVQQEQPPKGQLPEAQSEPQRTSLQ